MVTTGRPDVRPDAPSHVPGIHEGNQPGAWERMPGHGADGRVSSRRSTGVNAKAANPIDPQMPNLPPA
jgi:hypothetical protein